MAIFYVPNINSESVLPEEESLHAVKVLRLQAGSEIELVDGVGGYYKAKISMAHHKRCAFEIIESKQEFGKRNYKLHIAIAPTKNIDRLEWFVEKATEIGVDSISPILCRYSERKVLKSERLEKIIVSASKQSKKAYFPVLNELVSFDEFLISCSAEQKFIAHCYEDDKKTLQQELAANSDALVLIGPEGDFSKEEVEKAIAQGFVPVSLGESRLRTETAGLVATAVVAFINQK
jgi:16S rRNA (uracil1498-N3)-methyltransferase